MRINLLESKVSARRDVVPVSEPDLVASELFVRACWLSGLKEAAAASYMRITPKRLSRQIGAEEHLSLRRMLNLPVSFWVVLSALVLLHKGMTLLQAIRALGVGYSIVSDAEALDALDEWR